MSPPLMERSSGPSGREADCSLDEGFALHRDLYKSLVAAAALLGCAASAGACSSDGNPDPGVSVSEITVAISPDAVPDPCALIPVEEIDAAFDAEGFSYADSYGRAPLRPFGSRNCNWQSSSSPVGISLKVVTSDGMAEALAGSEKSSASQDIRDQMSPNGQPVSGIGDSAKIQKSVDGGTIDALTGDTYLSLVVVGGATGVEADLRELMSVAIESLP